MSFAAAVLSLAACLCAASAFGAGSAHPASAEEAIAGALANVRSRYRAKLDHYGLTESYFDETSGICDLMLLDVQTWTKYQTLRGQTQRKERFTGDLQLPTRNENSMRKNLAAECRRFWGGLEDTGEMPMIQRYEISSAR